MPGEHALLSASGASIWMECTPSARLTEKLPESNSVYADEGTLAHSIGELIILKELGRITHSKFQHDLLIFQKDQLYSSEMLDYCEGYAAFVMEKFNEEPGTIIQPELRMDMSKYVPGGFGTSDIPMLRIISKILLVIDFKYGKGIPVSAVENKQERYYALGALEAFDLIHDMDEIEEVVMIIYQPRLDSISEDRIKTTSLRLWADTVLKPIAQMAWNGEGDFKPGDHCRFCRAKPTCKALAEFSLQAVKDMFQFDGTESAEAPEIVAPLFLTDVEIANVLAKSDLFKNWVGAVEEYAQDQAVKHGKKWPGFKLVHGRSNRKYTDEEEVASTLTIKGYKSTDIYNVKLKGITELTKQIGKTDFEILLKNLIIKPEGAPTLVPIADTRPEINSLAITQELFKNE